MSQSVYRARLIVSNCLRNVKKAKPELASLRSRTHLRTIANVSLMGFIATVHCTESGKDQTALKTKVDCETEKSITILINQSDEYFRVGKYEESYKVLEDYEDIEQADVLWRLARSLYNMSKQPKIKHSIMVDMVERSFELVSRAIKLEPNNYAVQKWMAIVLDAKYALQGTKARIQALPDFKKHLMRAMELNPKDATTIYILGQYCYNIASMPWYQRKIAAALFAKPPESSFEEALSYFTKAEEIDPNFYSLNLLMLGKTYMQLQKVDAALYWLKCASVYPIRTEEDKQVRKEAEELLKKLKAQR